MGKLTGHNESAAASLSYRAIWKQSRLNVVDNVILRSWLE